MESEKITCDMENLRYVSPAELIRAVEEKSAEKARFITATCLDRDETFEVIYHFDQDMLLENIGVKTGKDQPIPSVSGVYPCAFLVENEMTEFFGIRIDGIQKELDFGGRLYLTDSAPERPMLKSTEEKKG